MLKDAIVRFDTTFTTLITSWPSWLHTPMLVVTNVGQPFMMGLAAIVVAAYAIQHAQMRLAYGMGWALLAMGVNTLLKHFIHRTRPDTLYVSNMYFQTSSFPSGHAFGATVMCGLLGYLAIKYLPTSWGYAAAGVLGIFAVLVGISRVYLGAHYPTDVIAGWVLGAVVVALIVVFVKP